LDSLQRRRTDFIFLEHDTADRGLRFLAMMAARRGDPLVSPGLLYDSGYKLYDGSDNITMQLVEREIAKQKLVAPEMDIDARWVRDGDKVLVFADLRKLSDNVQGELHGYVMVNDLRQQKHTSYYAQGLGHESIFWQGDSMHVEMQSTDMYGFDWRSPRVVVVIDRGELQQRYALQAAVADNKVLAEVSGDPIRWEYKRGREWPSARIGMRGDAVPWRARADGNWLLLSESEGRLPSGPIVSPKRDLAAGSYTGQVAIELPLLSRTYTIAVTALVRPSVTLETPAITWIVDPLHPPPEPVQVELSGDALAWTATADQGWIQLVASSGIVPDGPVVSYAGDLAAGTHSGTLTVHVPASDDHFSIPVTAMVGQTSTIFLPHARRG
jgi:hypothetical protein